MRSLDIHEDDLRQITLQPRANYVAYPGQTWDIGDAQVYSPGEATIDVASLGIDASEIGGIASGYFQAYDRVTTGYSGSETLLEGTRAFGNSRDCVVFISSDAEGRLTGVWFLLESADEKESFVGFLQAMSRFGEFIFEDAPWCFQCRPDERELLDCYFEDKFECA